MNSFSLKRVGWLFKKHYSESRNSYLALAFMLLGMPFLFAIVGAGGESAVTTFKSVVPAALVYIMHITVGSLRDKHRNIVEFTTPVSVGERYAFIWLNTTVLFAIYVAICYVVSLTITHLVFPINEGFEWVMKGVFGSSRTYFGLVCIQAVVLVVNLASQKRLVLNYIVALGLWVLGQWLISEYVPSFYRLDVLLWVNVVIVVVGWVSGYFILRNRQIRV